MNYILQTSDLRCFLSNYIEVEIGQAVRMSCQLPSEYLGAFLWAHTLQKTANKQKIALARTTAMFTKTAELLTGPIQCSQKPPKQIPPKLL